MMKEKLSVVCKFGSMAPSVVIAGIQEVLKRHGVPLGKFSLYGEDMDFQSISSVIRKSERKTFNITREDYEFHYSSVGRNGFDHITIASKVPSVIDWDEWVALFLGQADVVMAWVVDCDYDYWQNAEDPLQYTALKKSYSHLPMRSNNLPYPLEQLIIDTSNNPGRRIFRKGYLEAVGSVMWLGSTFWEKTGADQGQIENALWLNITRPTPLVVKLKTADHCFSTAEGSSGQLQYDLRSVLFPARAG